MVKETNGWLLGAIETGDEQILLEEFRYAAQSARAWKAYAEARDLDPATFTDLEARYYRPPALPRNVRTSVGLTALLLLALCLYVQSLWSMSTYVVALFG